MAVLEKVALMGGEFELVRLSQRPKTWYFRFYVRGSGQQKKGYVVRSLKTDDRGQAERRAYEEWRKLKTIEEDGGSITAKSIQDLMDDWLDKSFQRVVTGEIEQNTWRSKRSFFTNSLKNFFYAKGIKRVTDLQADTFDDFRFWRMTEGWKFYDIKDKAKRQPPKDSTINSEIGLINEWYNNYLIPKGYVRKKPLIKRKELDVDDLSANPPIPLKEWEKVWRWMEKWTNPKRKLSPHTLYWRMCFRHYLLCAYNAGTRPTELCGRYNKEKEIIDRGITWEDVEIVPQTRWSEKLKKEVEDKPVAVLEIRKTKTKVSRTVPCRVADYLIRWRDFCVEWRQQNGYPPLKPSDLVFVNPKTDMPYSYTMYSSRWQGIRDEFSKINPTEPIIIDLADFTFSCDREFSIEGLSQAAYAFTFISDQPNYSYFTSNASNKILMAAEKKLSPLKLL